MLRSIGIGIWRTGRALVGAGILGIAVMVFVELDPFDWFRGVDRARDILAMSPQAQGGDIGQKWAIEFLHKNGKMPQRINVAQAPLRNLDLRPRSDNEPKGADLQMAIMYGAIVEHAKLQCADLWRADLREAFLTKAKLQHARLFGAFLQGADLSNADLTGTDLTQTDLTNADLRGATVTAEQLTKACADPKSPPLVDPENKPENGWRKCERWTKDAPAASPPQCPISW